MNWGRERWVKYAKTPIDRERVLGVHGALLWPMLLKRAAPKGRVELRPGGPPAERQLFAQLGGRPGRDDRLIAHGLAELLDNGLVAIDGSDLVIVNWAATQSKKAGSRDTWPFFRLYVRETGPFSRLPYGARGLAANLLRFVDDDGRLERRPGESWGDRLTATAQSWVYGEAGTRHFVRSGMFDGWIADLVGDGYLVEEADGGVVVIRNYTRAQVIEDEEEAAAERAGRRSAPVREGGLVAVGNPVDEDPAAAPEVARDGREAGATLVRPWREAGVSLVRDGRESRPKSLELFDTEMPERSVSKNEEIDPVGTGVPTGGGSSLPAGGTGAGSDRTAAQAVVRRGRRSRHPYHQDFERVWHEYPTRDGERGPKLPAHQRFHALARERGLELAAFADLLLADLRRRKAAPRWAAGKPPDMVTYLNQRRFEDPLPETPGAAQRARDEARRREAEERERRAPPYAQRVERVALEETDWRGPNAAEVWRRPYDSTLAPEAQLIWDRVIRARLGELAQARYPREQLPLWAQQFLATHPRRPRADGAVRSEGSPSGWPPKSAPGEAVPMIRPRPPSGEAEVQRFIGDLAQAKAVRP